MNKRQRPSQPTSVLDRRGFLLSGGAIAGVALGGCATSSPPTPGTGGETEAAASAPPPQADKTPPRVREYRVLGRTGFKVSDISFGCGRLADANLVRFAVEKGINFLDTAEGYGNGDSERMIGQAMPHLKREELFIVTKLKLQPDEGEQSVVQRLGRCLERLKTDHVDALYMHSVTDAKMVRHPGFHAAIKRLKAAGRVKHAGISSHGPRGKEGDSMADVLLAAAADGRFDLMLLVHNFLQRDPGQRVLTACRERNIGTTLMKTAPARLKQEPFDPDSPSEEHARAIRRLIQRGSTREEAVARLKKQIARTQAEMSAGRQRIDAFLAEHGIRSEEQLAEKSVRWTLSNPEVHTVCVTLRDFEAIETYLAGSGKRLSASELSLLRGWAAAFSTEYCRHGCERCAGACPRGVPINTVMRYAYYFEAQGRQRYAMEKYAALGEADGASCLVCSAPCRGACPHGLHIPAQLLAAHQRLALS